ncbi:MAG: hypothetical protein FD156_2019 [Nitrospirae bacterium]|nr:MAG: hypothetical protein FD156_2019 [Nitrospirota bacterium]
MDKRVGCGFIIEIFDGRRNHGFYKQMGVETRAYLFSEYFILKLQK